MSVQKFSNKQIFKFQKTILTLVLVVLLPTQVQAQTISTIGQTSNQTANNANSQNSSSSGSQTNSTTITNSTTQTGSGSTATDSAVSTPSLSSVVVEPTSSPSPGHENNIQPNSQAAAKKAMTGAMLAGIAGGIAGVKTYSTCAQCFTTPTGPECWQCKFWAAGTVAAAAVAISQYNAAQKAMNSANSVTGVIPGFPTDLQTFKNSTDSSQSGVPSIDKSIPPLARKGIKFDFKKGTATMPNGTTISGSSASSPQALAAAGYSPSQIKNLQNEMKKVEEEAQKKLAAAGIDNQGFEGGGGGGHAAAMPGLPNIEVQGQEKIEVSRDPAQVAGMAKNFNGELIGVSQDNVFTMVSRRYQLKASQNNFLDSAVGGTVANPTSR